MLRQCQCTRTCCNRSHSSGLSYRLHPVSCAVMLEYNTAQRISTSYVIDNDTGLYIRHKVLSVCGGDTCGAIGKGGYRIGIPVRIEDECVSSCRDNQAFDGLHGTSR